ncbi:hypothetical protein KKC1_13820 [Calderihabitans maritimus]|uniref:Uncharacterized protein n=1 Tax=Calderihabitans maritimus TaxID=1246530 RepID=A0A1Z5HRT1_9FIRM|nr:hypothetical protein KKC1_13820 [Calderihabitans maritimus]
MKRSPKNGSMNMNKKLTERQSSHKGLLFKSQFKPVKLIEFLNKFSYNNE